MLYGMAEPARRTLRALGQRVRVYAPVGELLPGMAYLVRRLLENTANSGFLRLSVHEKVDLHTLLARPQPHQDDARPTLLPSGDLSTPFANCPQSDFTSVQVRSDFARAIDSVAAV